MSRSHDSQLPVAAILACLLVAVAIASCNYSSDRMRPPAIDPRSTANRAMEMYDANSDGYLADDELDKVPGIKAAMATVDADKNNKASAEEIAQRLQSWQESQVGVAGVRLIVTLDGQPLQGATVTFEPESFLGDQFIPGEGRTDDIGMTAPRIPKEKRPSPDMPGGLQLGFYRVKISKLVNGKETVPAKYNTETTLGQQIAFDDPALMGSTARFDLKSQ